MFKKSVLFPLALFLFVFAVYLVGISGSVYGGDSGDVILAAFFGGVAHPPGYPLNSILGYFFTHLPIGASVAFKANIAMAAFMAGAIVFLFLILKILLRNVFVALSASLVLAFSPLFWLYAHVTEVFQLNILLVAISFYFLISWTRRVNVKKGWTADKLLRVSVLFLGLAVFHHQTSLLVIPAYLYLIYQTDKKWFAISKKSAILVLMFLLGGLPYLAVPFLALRQTPINWDNPINFHNFIQLFTRADYGAFVASPSFVGATYKARLLQVVSYFAFIKNDFTLAGSALILFGVFYTFLKERKMFCFLFLATFFSGPFFLFYSSFTLSSDFLFGIWERFILLSYFFLAIFLAYGLYFLYLIFKNISWKKHFPIRKQVFLVVIQISFLLLPLYMVRSNWQRADMSKFELGDWLGHDVLASSADKSIIFLFDDTTTFNSQYIYYTNSNYKDKSIVITGLLRHLYYRQQLVRQYPALAYPQNFLSDIKSDSTTFMISLIRANLDKYPIYTFEFAPNIDGYTWETIGFLRRLFAASSLDSNRKLIVDLNNNAYQAFQADVTGINTGYSNFIPSNIKASYVNAYNSIGNEMLKVGANDGANVFFNKALVLDSKNVESFVGLAFSYLESGKCSEAKILFKEAQSVDLKSLQVLRGLRDVASKCDNSQAEVKYYDKLIEEITNGSSDTPLEGF